jgi:hypothetical protein
MNNHLRKFYAGISNIQSHQISKANTQNQVIKYISGQQLIACSIYRAHFAISVSANREYLSRRMPANGSRGAARHRIVKVVSFFTRCRFPSRAR